MCAKYGDFLNEVSFLKFGRKLNCNSFSGLFSETVPNRDPGMKRFYLAFSRFEILAFKNKWHKIINLLLI